MTWNICGESSASRAVRARCAALCALLTAAGCYSAETDPTPGTQSDPALAALMEDGVLPATMQAGTLAPTAPARFCGGFDPGDGDAGVSEPPIGTAGKGGGVPIVRPSGPALVGIAGSASVDAGVGIGGSASVGPGIMAGAGGSIGSAGSGPVGDAGAGGVDPSCASVPIGFWTFDDCNTFRTDLFDRSPQGHTAFRNVDQVCASGQEGLAVAFSGANDLVYAPDQPDFGLDAGVTVAAWLKPDAAGQVRTIFRKRDDVNSAFALVLNGKKFQFIVRLASGQFASVSAPATLGTWVHVAATYDGAYLRIYLDGQEASHTYAQGKIARGPGPLLIGNDIAGRRFRGLIDNAWFNTMAAPAATILQLTCLHQPVVATVSPTVGPAVSAGTPVTYDLSIMNRNSASCAPSQFISFVSLPEQDFSAQPQFSQTTIASGETATVPVVVASGEETEPGSYPLDFQVFANDSGFFPGRATAVSAAGPAVSTSGPIPVPVGGAPAPGPVPEPEVTNQARAQYVVAEPSGCHVLSSREIMIRDVSVVDDPVRASSAGDPSDPSSGAWTFARLMERLSPTPDAAPDVTEEMFRTFLSTQVINSFPSPTRPPMDPQVLQPWPRTADGRLDLTRAPMRLLAIVNRLDLKNLAQGKAGEGRVVFGVLDPNGFPMEFTVIFEYLLPANTEAEDVAWVEAFHALRALPFPSAEYNAALQAITDRFTARDAIPTNPNGSALIDIRTNEIALSLDGQWQLREFHISPTTGFMDPARLALTPDGSFNFSETLGRFINANEDTIVTETHDVPALLEGAPFQTGAVFNNIDFWSAPNVTNNEARHKFSLNTCNGCHGAETNTPFLQVNPRNPGQASALSGFLTGTTVFDPVTGQQRRLSELARRRQLLESVVCVPEQP